MITLDMQGNPCPIPVIKAKKELENPVSDGVALIVDNIVAVQNLKKMADGMGYVFEHLQQGSTYTVTISKQPGITPINTAISINPVSESPQDGVTVLVSANKMGNGSEELGKILIKGFLFSLTELDTPPKTVIFLNSGVHLVAEGSNTVVDIQSLKAQGTKIMACGTCLNYYSLTEKLAVGEISDMFGITTVLASAKTLITL